MKLLKGILSLIQIIAFSVGLFPVKVNVQYGGLPYAPPEITTPLTIAENGRTDYVIVLPEPHSACIDTAARELRDYLKEISGAEPDIVSEADCTVNTKAVFLGK